MQRIVQLTTFLTGLFLIFIGIRFMTHPEIAENSFGIHFAEDQNYSFHLIKGIRDLFTGLFLLYLFFQNNKKILGWYLLLAAMIPLTDAWIVWGYNGTGLMKTLAHFFAIVICLVNGGYWILSKRPQTRPRASELEILESSQSTGGRQTKVRMQLAGGAATPAHYHRRFSEQIEILEGQLQVTIDGVPSVLKKGDLANIPKHALHQFANPSQNPCTILTTIQPADADFEKALLIYHYLNQEGKVNEQGIPKSIIDLSVFIRWNDTHFAGLLSPLNLVIKGLYWWARITNRDIQLLKDARKLSKAKLH